MKEKRCIFKVTSEEIDEIESDYPYNKRYFKKLFNKEVCDIAKATVFIERFEPGAESYPHYHIPPEVEIFFGLKGRGICELVNQDRTIIHKSVINQGDLFYCPENWIHKLRNDSDKEIWEILGIIIPI